MFILVISCLTSSNLPWFMDLTFQFPMQYCSLQHWTLLLSPITSATGCCFCFGSIPSFFLELFLHWSPVAYWVPTDLWSFSFSILSFFLFILFMGFSRQEYWSGLPGDQIANIHCIIEKAKNSSKASTSLTMLKALAMWITTNCGKFWKRWEYQTTLPVSWETCM